MGYWNSGGGGAAWGSGNGRFNSGMRNPRSNYMAAGNWDIGGNGQWVMPQGLSDLLKGAQGRFGSRGSGSGSGSGSGDWNPGPWGSGGGGGGLSGGGRSVGGLMPEGWQEPAGSAATGGRPEDVIRAAEPGILEKMRRYQAEAAARLGSAGALRGTGYAKELTEGSRRAANDIGSIIANTTFQAAESQANRDEASRQASLERQYGGWENMGDWRTRLGQRDWELSADEAARRDELAQREAEFGRSLSSDQWNMESNDLMSLISDLMGYGYMAPSGEFAGLFGW